MIYILYKLKLIYEMQSEYSGFYQKKNLFFDFTIMPFSFNNRKPEKHETV